MSVFLLADHDSKPPATNDLSFPADAIVVNAHRTLLERVGQNYNSVNNENYYKEYAHWRGAPPKIVDTHPNEVAHKAIADAIVQKIRKVGVK